MGLGLHQPEDDVICSTTKDFDDIWLLSTLSLRKGFWSKSSEKTDDRMRRVLWTYVGPAHHQITSFRSGAIWTWSGECVSSIWSPPGGDCHPGQGVIWSLIILSSQDVMSLMLQWLFVVSQYSDIIFVNCSVSNECDNCPEPISTLLYINLVIEPKYHRPWVLRLENYDTVHTTFTETHSLLHYMWPHSCIALHGRE